MNPFRLEMRLTTPIVFGEHSPSLDGIVFEFLVEHLGDDEKAAIALPEYLKFTLGVPHASRLFFGTTENSALIAVPVTFINKLSDRILCSGLAPWGRRKTDPYPTVRQDGGPTRPRLKTHEGYWAPYLIFFGVGDIHRLSVLFDCYLTSVGSKSRQGFGGVTDINVVPVERDESWIKDGSICRFLPASIASDSGIDGVETYERLIPPFWRTTDRVSGFSPERIQTLFV